jgi:hypothetical protein
MAKLYIVASNGDTVAPTVSEKLPEFLTQSLEEKECKGGHECKGKNAARILARLFLTGKHKNWDDESFGAILEALTPFGFPDIGVLKENLGL